MEPNSIFVTTWAVWVSASLLLTALVCVGSGWEAVGEDQVTLSDLRRCTRCLRACLVRFLNEGHGIW